MAIQYRILMEELLEQKTIIGNGNVIQIMEYKDILALPDDKPYEVSYRKQNLFLH